MKEVTGSLIAVNLQRANLSKASCNPQKHPPVKARERLCRLHALLKMHAWSTSKVPPYNGATALPAKVAISCPSGAVAGASGHPDLAALALLAQPTAEPLVLPFSCPDS